MSSKKWVLYSISTVIIVLVFNFIFLFTIDTYAIANPQVKKYYTVPNQRYLITEYLLSKKESYNTYIFGSSRVEHINPLNIKNEKAYNMTYGEGIPHEHFIMIKLLIEKGIPIKHILIGLDDFSYQVPYSRHQEQFMPKSHYLATKESIVDFYKFYFFRKPKKADLQQFKSKYLGAGYNKPYCDGVKEVIFNQKHHYLNVSYENNNTKKYINNPIFSIPMHYSGNTLEDTLRDIQDIINIADANNIKTTFFINPIHKTTYKDTNQKLLTEFRKELSELTSYYDFSIPNKINNNNMYWYETSHFNNFVGNLMLSRMFENNTSIENFGTFIKKKTN